MCIRDRTGTILPGITRDSVLTLLRDWGVKATERRITLEELLAAAKNGQLREAFGVGTAAVSYTHLGPNARNPGRALA